jgi:hypothetical protein
MKCLLIYTQRVVLLVRDRDFVGELLRGLPDWAATEGRPYGLQEKINFLKNNGSDKISIAKLALFHSNFYS